MAAYSAVISLLQTLEQLQERNPKLIRDQVAKTLNSLQATAVYFQNVLEEVSSKSRSDPEKIKSLEEKIRVAANDAEDVVELKIGQTIKGLSWTFGLAPIILDRNLLPVVGKIDLTKKEVMEIVSDDFSPSIHHVDDEIVELSGDFVIGTSSRSSPMLPNLEDSIVQGLDDDLEIIINRLKESQSDLDVVTITGMGGIGKTTLARKAHDHLLIRYHFDIRVWITISQDFQSRNVLLNALHCISKQADIVNEEDYDKKNNNELADLVQKNLKVRRYLVVVDDIWSMDVWDRIRRIFPDCKNRSRILLTTRETEVAKYTNTRNPHEMNLLNLDNSWKLLRDKVFGVEHDHPPELEEIGKKIAEKCQGLPLTILLIAGHISKVTRTLESWKEVSQTLGEIIATHPDKCLAVLGLSYHHLPNHLKPCFLSMGDFSEDFQIDTWRLIQLWIAEGFIRTSRSGKSLEGVAIHYLEDLISRNMIIVRKRRFNGEIKACGVHDVLREFCLIEANATKFMHVKRTYQVYTPTQEHNSRRFNFQTQTYSSDDCWKLLPLVARSFYVFSQLNLPYANRHISSRYIVERVPYSNGIPNFVTFEVFSRFKLLRVLAIFHQYERFVSFPLVITKLFHLRYLAIRCEDNLPASISKLQHLRTLINHGNEYRKTTLPGEIWMMKNLRHIHLRGANYLPNPARESTLNKKLVTWMPNLEELFGLCSTSCTNEVFSAIPNLKRLIINQFRGNTHVLISGQIIDMSSLTKLESLECVSYLYQIIPASIKRFVFPTSLKRLTITGWFSFPWEDVSTLFILPNLEEFKLKDQAARGEVWRLSDECKFERLKFLLFDGLNLECWKANSVNFPNLKRLVLKKCKLLYEIPREFGEIFTLESIELHNCSTSAEDSAREIEQEQAGMGNNCLKVDIHNSHMSSLQRKMILPVYCFTCGKVIVSKYHKYRALLREGYNEEAALGELGFVPYCCRRMLTTSVDYTALWI